MNPPTLALFNADDEISMLIETMLATEQRLEELTGGEVDTVASRDGRTFLLRRAQEELRHREAARQTIALNELRGLFDLIPAMVWFKDTENNIVRINRQAADDIGKSVAELEGKAMGEIYPEDAAKYYADDLEVIRSGAPKLKIVETIRNRSGEKLWIQTDKVPVCDPEGKVVGIVVMAQDITERNRAAALLAESGQRLALAKESARFGIWEWEVESNRLVWDAQMYLLYGIREQDFSGAYDAWQKGLHPEDRKRTEAEIFAAVDGDNGFHAEFRIVWPGGEVRHIEAHAAMYRADGGTPRRMIGVNWDITERKRMDENVQRLAAIVESSADAIISKTLNGIITSWNPAAEKMFGYTAAEIIGQPLQWLVPPDRTDEEAEILAGFARGEMVRHIETVRVPKNGGRLDVSATISPIINPKGEIIGVSKIVRDITERKRMAGALQAEQAMLSSLVTTIPDTIYFKDRQSRFVRINDAMARRFGLQHASEAVGRTDFDFHGAEHARKAFEDEQHVMRTGEPLIGREEKETWSDGRITWSSSTKVALRDPQGRITGLVGISRDITAGKKAEARLRRLVDSNAQSVIFWNTTGAITDANDAFLKLAGYTREDLAAGRINWAAMTPPEYAHLDHRALAELAATGVCAQYEKEWVRKDSSRVAILLVAAMFEDDPGQGVCFVLDLTGQKKIENQFRQSQKMESIGQLAGGVAHDFNNILAVIQIQSELLRLDGGLSPVQSEHIEGIGAATRRAIALTRQLLLFSRKETMQLRDLDLNQSINDVTNMLRRVLGEHIQIQFKFSLLPLFIHADAGMLDQVLMNLAVNSRDAMPGGGRLIIDTSAVDFDETITGQSAHARPGSFVCLSVSDSGCGIPPENLSKIFEPFFTTKDVGRGTGLGLATVFGIVQQHKGWINVYSEVGQGTTFRIYLPRLANAAILPPPPKPAALPAQCGGGETILLVEDDDFLRPSIHQTLFRLGYRVLEASNGIKALEIWKQHRDEIHLVLTDLVMPGGMAGKNLGELLLKQKPQLKVIYASGYSADIIGADFPLKEGVNFLTKPFQAQKLAETIRRSLDSSN